MGGRRPLSVLNEVCWSEVYPRAKPFAGAAIPRAGARIRPPWIGK